MEGSRIMCKNPGIAILVIFGTMLIGIGIATMWSLIVKWHEEKKQLRKDLLDL